MSSVSIKLERCKRCGYCINYCPKGVFDSRNDGKAYVKHEDKCINCKLCEKLCPDFAITVKEVKL